MNRLPYFSLLFLLFAVASCRKTISSNREEEPTKESSLFHDHAKTDFRFGNFDSLVINQGMYIIDASQNAQPDSSYHEPGIYYKWQSLPSTGCDSLVNNNGYAGVQVMFHCAGDYHIFASIYDSATNKMVGNTDTVTLHVSSDTLNRFTPFKENDNLRIDAAESYTYPDQSDSVLLWFHVITTEPYTLFVPSVTTYTDSISSTDFYAFFTGIAIESYPFISRPDKVTDNIVGQLRVPFYSGDNSIKNIHIVYNGNTYTGSIERTSSAYLIHWNYSSGVIFSVSEIRR